MWKIEKPLEAKISQLLKRWGIWAEFDQGLRNEDKVSATIIINHYIYMTYDRLMFQMEKDFKELKPVRSNPK